MRSERFATSNEIRNVLSPIGCEGGGLVLHTYNGENFVYTKEGHQLILGVSGAGKSRRGTLPQARALIEAGENMICIDPKGELYKQTACYAKDTHKVSVVNFRNPTFSECWNPLAFPRTLFSSGENGLAQQMVQEIVFNLSSDNGRNTDRFWIDSERNLLSGIINLLIEYAPKGQCNFSQIIHTVSQDFSSLQQTDQTVSGGYLLDIVEALPTDSPAKQLLASYTNLTAKTTRSCIMSEVTNTISKFCTTEDVIAMTSGDDIDIANMDVDEPFALYIILPDDSAIFNVLSGLLVSQISHRLIKLADNKYDGKLPIRTNFIIEETGNIGHSIAGLPFLMTASRSRNIRMTLILQALSQLESIYGRSRAETILSCADVWVCFRTSDWGTLAELSRKCGERKIQAGDIRFVQALLSEPQLMAMGVGQALIFVSGRTKYIEQLPDYTAMFPCDDLHEIPIQKIGINKANNPINLTEMKNIISSRKKARTANSFYKSKFLGVSSDE